MMWLNPNKPSVDEDERGKSRLKEATSRVTGYINVSITAILFHESKKHKNIE